MVRLAVAAVAAAAAVAALAARAAGHGLVVAPRQRGALRTSWAFPVIDATAPKDDCPHCLSGGNVAGANGGAWTPYDPLDPVLGPRRANDHGACGDPAGPSGAHMAGGRYYHGGKPVATYTSGGTIDFQLAITAHHNGFMEWWVCDADRCADDDPTGACFATPGACVRLERVPHAACEAGTETDCGPIQAAYPSRWYLPCKGASPPSSVDGPLVLGGPAGKMRYAIPAGFSCTRCVTQWYWATANSCSPPGVDDYDFPAAWRNCGAKLAACGAGGWPEEFWSCSDVTIKAAGGGGGAPQQTPQAPRRTPQAPRPTPQGPRPTPARTPQAQPPQLAPMPAAPTTTPPPRPSLLPQTPPVRPPPAGPPAGAACLPWGTWCVLERVAVGGACCAGTSCVPYEGSDRFSMCL